MRPIHARALAAISLSLAASCAWGQQTPPPGAGQQRETQTQPATPPTAPTTPSLPIAAYPLELLGLLGPRAQPGPVRLTPSIAISEEYNDNIFLNNRNRQWDFITNLTPALTLVIQRPEYDLSAGYSFRNVWYAREDRLNNAFDSQNFVASGHYRLSRDVTLSASDSFVLSRSTNLVSSQGFSTGRQESWSNNFYPGLTWQVTPLNNLSLTATYGVLRFEGAGTGADSDTYGIQGNFTHAFTTRFSGIIGYGFTYLDLRAQPNSSTHSPTIGFSYLLTPTLSATITGGAAVTDIAGDTFVSPSGTASIVQTFSFGAASLNYSQGVGVAGGFGSTTDTQTVSALLTLSTLVRGLLVTLGPAYNNSKSLSSSQPGRADVRNVTFNIGATYQIAQYASLFGGYTFLYQRTGASSSTQIDANQNLVRFGLQFGYPFDFD